jgi:hypothetical protein
MISTLEGTRSLLRTNVIHFTLGYIHKSLLLIEIITIILLISRKFSVLLDGVPVASSRDRFDRAMKPRLAPLSQTLVLRLQQQNGTRV